MIQRPGVQINIPLIPAGTPSIAGQQVEMYWLWTTGGSLSPNFPKPGREDRAHKFDWEPSLLPEFTDAIGGAAKRVLILDPHFDEKIGLIPLWPFFVAAAAPEIQILVPKKIEFLLMKNWMKTNAPDITKVRVRKTPLSFHDRFAVVDNDLWHFGSTVGGGHPKFSAVTKGWNGDIFAEVFRSLWEKAEA